MDRFGKFFLIFLTAFALYAVVVGTFVPPMTSVSFRISDIVALTPWGALLAISGIAGALADLARQKEREFRMLLLWGLTAIALGFGLVGWVLVATSPFLAFGFIPIVVVSFLAVFLWDVPLVQMKSQRS